MPLRRHLFVTVLLFSFHAAAAASSYDAIITALTGDGKLENFFSPAYRTLVEDSAVIPYHQLQSVFRTDRMELTAFSSKGRVQYRLYFDSNGFITDSLGFIKPLISPKTLKAAPIFHRDSELLAYWRLAAGQISVDVFNTFDRIHISLNNPTAIRFYELEVVLEFFDGNRRLIGEQLIRFGSLNGGVNQEKEFKIPTHLQPDLRHYRATVFFYKKTDRFF